MTAPALPSLGVESVPIENLRPDPANPRRISEDELEALTMSLHEFGFVQPVAFVIFFIGGLAETNRSPFDLPEAEQELTGGFHTEYSGMRFALFFLAEYANMIVVSSVATTLFLGGWLRPFPNVAALGFLDVIPSWTWFLIKSFVFLYIFIWVRATLPRYRYDQLMRLGWKVLIPLAIANLVLTGIVKVALS